MDKGFSIKFNVFKMVEKEWVLVGYIVEKNDNIPTSYSADWFQGDLVIDAVFYRWDYNDYAVSSGQYRLESLRNGAKYTFDAVPYEPLSEFSGLCGIRSLGEIIYDVV